MNIQKINMSPEFRYHFEVHYNEWINQFELQLQIKELPKVKAFIQHIKERGYGDLEIFLRKERMLSQYFEEFNKTFLARMFSAHITDNKNFTEFMFSIALTSEMEVFVFPLERARYNEKNAFKETLELYYPEFLLHNEKDSFRESVEVYYAECLHPKV